MTRATTMMVLFLALLVPQTLLAQPSGNELLKQVCADIPTGDSCQIAKNYPNAPPDAECSIELNGEISGIRMEGRYVDPGYGNSDGSILLLGYESGCEGTQWGGSLIFDRINSEYVFRGYRPGWTYKNCLNIKKDHGERLFCRSWFTQQGVKSTTLSELRFGRDLAGNLHVDNLILLDGLDDEAVYGAITVNCSSKIEIIGFDHPRPGPTNSSIRLSISYVDEAAIRKACAPGARPPKEVAERRRGVVAPTDETFISRDRIRKEDFVLDLNTRQLISQKSGKSFNPRRRSDVWMP